jgi:protein-S-isoprenylcysteine O-methyltransferase Ste14
MFVLIRAATYAALFIGFVLVFLPARVLSQSGIIRPPAVGILQLAGMIVVGTGATIALWCVGTLAIVGRGTPAPFDPPRRLVVQGPYRLVRNPMYLGGTLALGGAALFYESWALLGYAGVFFVAVHMFAVGYEEPTLRRTFGSEYDDYCKRVRRWSPKI